jgi:hypothetical protein
MPTFEYLTVTVNHNACEINVARGGAPEDVAGGYFRLSAVFNQLGSEGWLLRASVHEQLGDRGAYTLHTFGREAS